MFTGESIIRLLVSIITFVCYAGVIYIIGTAAHTILSGAKARWDALVFAAVVLMAAPEVVREYPPIFLEAVYDSLQASYPVMERIEDSLNGFVGSRLDHLESSEQSDYIITTGAPTPVPQSVPQPTATPTVRNTTYCNPVEVKDGFTIGRIADAWQVSKEDINRWTEGRDLSDNNWELIVGEYVDVCGD